MYAAIQLRFNLRVILFQKFPGGWGHAPRPPPRRLVLHIPGCALHTRMMGMQFQKRPIKFTFDWPFCRSNNFPLYCTLLQWPNIQVCLLYPSLLLTMPNLMLFTKCIIVMYILLSHCTLLVDKTHFSSKHHKRVSLKYALYLQSWSKY